MQQPKVFIEQAGDEITVKVMKIPVLEKGQVLPRRKKNTDKAITTGKRFSNNVFRAKKIVYELVMCNDWELYGTVTIDGQKWDRNDLPAIAKAFTDFIRNTAAALGCTILRVIVPEQHAYGAWHFHFVLFGLPISELRIFIPGQKLPDDIRIKMQLGIEVYNWPACAEKFGFCQLEPIGGKNKDKKAVANYMRNAVKGWDTKYGKHLYYASQGLARATRIAEGTACRDLIGPGVHEDGYVKTKKFGLDQLDEALSYVRPANTVTITAGDLAESADDNANSTPIPQNSYDTEKMPEN